MEDGQFGVVGKRHLTVGNIAVDRLAGLVSAFIDLGRGVHNLENPLSRRAAGLENLVELVEASDGFVEVAGQNKKRHQRADLELSIEDLARAKRGHD